MSGYIAFRQVKNRAAVKNLTFFLPFGYIVAIGSCISQLTAWQKADDTSHC